MSEVLHTVSHVHPDMRCDSTATGNILGEDYTTDCVLEDDHQDSGEGEHTDGNGAFWDDDGEVEYR